MGIEMIISPKKMAFLCILPILLAGTIAWGVKTITSEEAAPIETKEVAPIEMKKVNAVEPPFKLVMSLNKTEYKPGELIVIDLKMINIGNSTVTLDFLSRSPPTWLRFKLYNASDDLVFESELAEWPAGTEISLDPGSFIGQKHKWGQTVSKPWMPVRLLEPGTYEIVGFLDRLDTPEITLETPPVQISIG